MHTYTIELTDEQRALLERYAAEINALVPDHSRSIENNIEALLYGALLEAARLWSLPTEAEVAT